MLGSKAWSVWATASSVPDLEYSVASGARVSRAWSSLRGWRREGVVDRKRGDDEAEGSPKRRMDLHDWLGMETRRRDDMMGVCLLNGSSNGGSVD